MIVGKELSHEVGGNRKSFIVKCHAHPWMLGLHRLRSPVSGCKVYIDQTKDSLRLRVHVHGKKSGTLDIGRYLLAVIDLNPFFNVMPLMKLLPKCSPIYREYTYRLRKGLYKILLWTEISNSVIYLSPHTSLWVIKNSIRLLISTCIDTLIRWFQMQYIFIFSDEKPQIKVKSVDREKS